MAATYAVYNDPNYLRTNSGAIYYDTDTVPLRPRTNSVAIYYDTDTVPLLPRTNSFVWRKTQESSRALQGSVNNAINPLEPGGGNCSCNAIPTRVQ